MNRPANANPYPLPGDLTCQARCSPPTLYSALLTQLTADVKHAHPLTIREAEIATLVATGMSNRQIAQQFVLSERTIESHIRNIWASRTSPVAQTSPAGSGTTPRRHACAETV